MSAHNFGMNLDRALRMGFLKIRDPLASGTFSWHNQGIAYVEVVTLTAESRALPAASGYAPGTKLIVDFKTDGGDLTITGASNGSQILDTVGARAEFQVVDVNGTRTWKRTDVPLGERLRQSSTATSGAVEGIYTRLAFEADGSASGSALRAFTNVNANIGTARGAHISLSFEASAGGSETSGLGTALTGTLHIPNVALWAPTGTLYAGQFEIFSDGASSDPAGLTELAVLSLTNSGNATGMADVDTDAAIIAITGFTPAADLTKAITTAALAELATPGAVGLKIKIAGVNYRIPAVPDAEWN